jgi:hypothetical protein
VVAAVAENLAGIKQPSYDRILQDVWTTLDPIHASLVLSSIEGGVGGASTSSIVEEGD